MRPVTKVNPPSYLYFNLASLNNLVPAFAAGSAICIVYNQLGGFQRSVAWVQNELLAKMVNNQAFPNPSTPLNRGRARNIMKQRLETIYGGARGDLVGMFGDYCSFCEIPLAGHLLAVEHRVAKSIYPTFTVLWSNFLLACRDCNSVKGDRPPRATAIGWAGGAPFTEDELNDEIEGHYYWADLYPQTFRRIARAYWRETRAAPAAQVQLLAADYSSRQNWLVASGLAVVRANVRSGGAMRNNRYVEVRIFNNGGGNRGNRTLPLTGLDDEETGRCAQRTIAWLAVCQTVDNLLTAVLAVPAGMPAVRAVVFDAIWNTTLLLAVNVGFYSVWVDVLLNHNIPAGANARGYHDLGDMFIGDTQAANNPNVLQVFDGTDVTQVP